MIDFLPTLSHVLSDRNYTVDLFVFSLHDAYEMRVYNNETRELFTLEIPSSELLELNIKNRKAVIDFFRKKLDWVINNQRIAQ